MEAIIIFGIGSLLLGVLLYIAAMYFLRRNRASKPHGGGHRTITKWGFVFFTIFIMLMLMGFIQQYVAPHSTIGRLASTSGGRLFLGAILCVMAWPIEAYMRRRGIKIVEDKEKKDV